MAQFTVLGYVNSHFLLVDKSNARNLQFKSWTGGNGLAENVTYQDITVKNVSTPIFVTQKSVGFLSEKRNLTPGQLL